MEITWYGISCFKLAEKGMATVVTDPDDRADRSRPLKFSANIVTISRGAGLDSSLETTQSTAHVINGAGEYEVGGVFITGVHTGSGLSRKTLYVFDYNGLTVAHLGNLNHVPTQAEVEAIGTVNIALVPIGGSEFGLSIAKAAEVISLLEPNIVIPMYTDASSTGGLPESLNKFLKEMGISEPDRLPALKVSSTALPEETKVIVLDYQLG